MARTRISPSIFYKYFTCPHWVWFDYFGDKNKKGQPDELQKKLLEQGVAHEENFMREYVKEREVKTVVADMSAAGWKKAVAQTRAFMVAGADVIYQGRLQSEKFEGIPDLLVRRTGKSKWGNWFYEPIDIKSAHDLKEEYKYQLTMYAVLLEAEQDFKPAEAGVITVDHARRSFSVPDFEPKFWSGLAEIEKIIAGEKPPLQLTKACMNSPWFSECQHQAEAANDISLLYKVDRRSLAGLRAQGINTVEDARQINPAALDGLIPYLKKNGLERMKLQAESLARAQGGAPQSETIFIRKNSRIPTAPLEIHFDIEGDPLYGVEYLFGFLLDDGVTQTYKSFVAEQPEDEGKMWREFLDWIKTLPEDFVVYHYATYEKSRLTMLAKKYASEMSAADNVALEKFAGKLFDLNDIIKENFVFPLYFYGLKQVGKFLGFSWSSKKAGGAQSIFWYEEWLEKKDREILDTIIQYNEDDVRATKFLKEWVAEHAQKKRLTAIFRVLAPNFWHDIIFIYGRHGPRPRYIRRRNF